MTISFKHSYDKLKAREFTTIRSKAFGDRIRKHKQSWIECRTPDEMAIITLRKV